MSLESNGLDRLLSLRKIPTRLRGTNFCISLAGFALCFVTQPNGPKCTKIVWNTMKHEFWVQWGGWVRPLWKILTRLHGTNLCTTSARFAPSFVRQPNGTKWTQTVRNTAKHEFWVQWGGSGAFTTKNSDATSWHELLHQFGPFRTECCNATNCPKCTQIVRIQRNMRLGPNGVDRVVCCEKFRHDFMARNFAPLQPVLHRVL